jgi:hypothetical protein
VLVDSITVYRFIGLSFGRDRGHRQSGGGWIARRQQGSQEHKFLDTRIRHAAAPPFAQLAHMIAVIITAFGRTLVARICCPARPRTPVLPADLIAVGLAAIARDADLKGPQAPGAAQIQKCRLFHPLAGGRKLDGGRALGDLPSARPSAHGGSGG